MRNWCVLFLAVGVVACGTPPFGKEPESHRIAGTARVTTDDGTFTVTQDVDRALWSQDAGLPTPGPLGVSYDFSPSGYDGSPEISLDFELTYPGGRQRILSVEMHGAMHEGTFALSDFGGCLWTCDAAHPIQNGSFCEPPFGASADPVGEAVEGTCAPVEGTITLTTISAQCPSRDAFEEACDARLDAHVEITRSPGDAVRAVLELHEVQRRAID